MKFRHLTKKLDFTTLLIFQSICECGSLSESADKNAIALSAASKRLSDLETMVGTKLFIRTKSGMSPTPAGESLLYYSRLIFDNFYRATTELEEYRSGLKGFVHLQANMAAIIQFLPKDLNAFIDNNPAINIELEQLTSNQIIENIKNNKADLGICVVDKFCADLHYKVYASDELVLVAKNQAFFDDNRIADLDGALAYDFIGLQANSAINQALKNKADELNQPLKLRLLMSSFDSLCCMAQAGMGIGIIPKQVFEIFGKPLGLGILPINESWAVRKLHLVSRADSELSAVALLLKKHLLKI